MNEPIKCYRMGGFDVREYAETPSTNTLAESLSPGELHDRTVILTWRQTAGRGQVGNRWESAPERNISMTVVLKPDALPADRQFAVSMAVRTFTPVSMAFSADDESVVAVFHALGGGVD